MEQGREQVLNMLSEGKISSEDAQRLLEALGEPEETFSTGQEPSTAEGAFEEEASEGQAAAFVPKGQGMAQEMAAPRYFPLARNGISHEESTAPEGLQTLVLNWVSGPVELRCFEGEDLRITEYSSRPLDEEERMEVSFQSGVLEIGWRRREARPFFGRRMPEKHLVLELPQGCLENLKKLSCALVSGSFYAWGISAEDLEIRTVSGMIYGESLSGESVKLRSVSGKVTGRDLHAGRLEVSSTSGKAALSGFEAGSLLTHTVSGKIELQGNSESFDLKSVSGAISLDAFCCPREGNFHTTSGKIRTAFPDNAGFSLEYHTSSGHFQSQYPLSGELGRKRGTGVYGLGGAQFHYHTSSGAICLERLTVDSSAAF